ncbi:MAG: HAMP domain-containing sensor histidine kinase [Patescibacteria group bacterium]|nr:MAG: HAMP domain-containing sensor histidine kinase [Patescibacteria group bacterium]
MAEAILEAFALLGRLSGDSVFVERYRIRANETFLDKSPARAQRFAKLYLEAEAELVRTSKGALSQEQIRSQVLALFPEDTPYRAFRMLLLAPEPQLLALASALLSAYAERSRVFFGERVSERILAKALDETPWKGVKPNLTRGIPYQPERMRTLAECSEIVAALFEQWYGLLHVTLGHKTSRNLFEMAYLDVEAVYGFLPALKNLLGLTPTNVLWASKVKLLHALERETSLQAKGLRTADQDLRRQAEHLQQTVRELQEAREQLEATARARSEFIDVVSHQFRTPLSSIRWSGELLADAMAEKRLAPELREAVETVRQRSVYLSQTLDRVFATLDIETGKLVIDPKPAFLWELVQNIHDRVEKDLARRKLKWSFERTKSQIREIPIDKAKIDFALKIVVDNAIMYAKEGSTVTVRIADAKINGIDCQVCSVSDQGIGFSKDNLERVFDKFFRSQDAVLASPDGTGLGLFIVKHYVEAHGGKIWIESEGEGKGSTVIIALSAGTSQAR